MEEMTTESKKTVMIGHDLIVNRIGSGTNSFDSEFESQEALITAVSSGVNFVDTAAAYSGGESEKAVGKFLAGRKDVIVATKGGMVAPDFHVDSRPEILGKQLDNSLKNLQRDRIDLYFLHRIDPKVPLAESLDFLKRKQAEGVIRHIGLSAVTIEEIKKAREIVDVVAVENEYNLATRHHDPVVDYCEKEGIVFIPYYPLQFNLDDNPVWEDLKTKYYATETQLGLAWLLARSPIILPIPGSLDPGHIRENVAALDIVLSAEDFGILSSLS